MCISSGFRSFLLGKGLNFLKVVKLPLQYQQKLRPEFSLSQQNKTFRIKVGKNLFLFVTGLFRFSGSVGPKLSVFLDKMGLWKAVVGRK